VHQAPGIPHALFVKGGKFMHDSDAFAPRECGVMSEVAAQPAARKIALCFRVMAGLVPAIHVLESKERKTWMPGTSARSKASSPRPGMTEIIAGPHSHLIASRSLSSGAHSRNENVQSYLASLPATNAMRLRTGALTTKQFTLSSLLL
jgi:hypothetical protein